MTGDLLFDALHLAHGAHRGQTRKYTGEPYIHHPVAVASIVADIGAPDWLIAAAYLHDVVEDTDTTLDDLWRQGIKNTSTIEAVDYMTERPHEGNRATRKAAECERLAQGTAWQQTFKLADMIDNTRSIGERDPKFAAVYLAEKEALVNALTLAAPVLRGRADAMIHRGLRRIDGTNR